MAKAQTKKENHSVGKKNTKKDTRKKNTVGKKNSGNKLQSYPLAPMPEQHQPRPGIEAKMSP